MTTLDKFTESEQMASMENHIQKGNGHFNAIETDNTLSNVTSIQSQLQSLYDCTDTIKICDKYNNYKNINFKPTTDKLEYTRASNTSENINTNMFSNIPICSTENVNSTILKISAEIQHNSEHKSKSNYPAQPEYGKSLSHQMTSKQYIKESTAEQYDSNNPTALVTSAGTLIGLNNTKTATILVSKTKTKTGLPLLLKNSIN